MKLSAPLQESMMELLYGCINHIRSLSYKHDFLPFNIHDNRIDSYFSIQLQTILGAVKGMQK